MIHKKRTPRVHLPTNETGWAPGHTLAVEKNRGAYPWKSADNGNLVEVVIPTIVCADLLPYTIELIRLQTGVVRPYIVIIDTGSPPEEQKKIEALRAPDVEVHLLTSRGYRHASDPVAVALDLALSLCRTEKQVTTHADCFLLRRDALSDLVERVNPDNPVVGYQISPRPGVKDWERMIGHTWSAFDVASIRKRGITWGYGASVDTGTSALRGRWDTEYGFMRQCWREGIEPDLMGTEENFERNISEDFDHIRSLPSARLYDNKHLAKAEGWVDLAISDAKERIESWKNSTT